MKKSISKWLSLLSLFFSCGLFAETGEEPYLPQGARGNRIDFKHLEYQGIGFNEGYSSIDLFLSNPQAYRDCLYVFFDGRAHIFNSGRPAANAGIGFRYVRDTLNEFFGFNAYYDYRNTKKRNWNQVGAGLEYLMRKWEFRLNGYLPIGPKLSRSYDLQFSHFTGHSVVVTRRYEFSMYGADSEAGYHFKRWKNFDFYVGAGAYAFKGKIGDPAIGGKLRIKGRLGDYFQLEVSDSYDHVFRNRFSAEAAITVPFGPRSKPTPNQRTSCCEQNIFSNWIHEPPYRNEIIVLDDKTKSTVAIDPGTGLPYFFWFVDNTSSSLGTYESPYPTLAAAQASARQGEVIYVFPGDGTTTGMDVGITLQNRQQFLGSGVIQELETSFGALTIPAQTRVSPNITTQAAGLALGDPVVRIANNNIVSGFVIHCNDLNSDPDPYGIGSDGIAIENLVVKNNQILSGPNATTVHGIDLTNAIGTIIIQNNLFNMNDGSGGGSNNRGISITNTNQSNATFLIEDNTFLGLAFYVGTFSNCANMNTTFAGNDILTDFTVNCISLTATATTAQPTSYVTVKNNRCVGEGGGPAFTLGSGASHIVNTDLIIQNNRINSSSASITITSAGSGTTNANITNNYLTAGSGEGMTITPANSTNFHGTILNNSIVPGASSSGLAFAPTSTGSSSLLISQNQIFGGTDGLSLSLTNTSGSGGATVITVDDNDFLNQGTSGISASVGGGGSNAVSTVLSVTNSRFSGIESRALSATASTGGTLCMTFTDNFSSAPRIYAGSSYVGAYSFTQSATGVFRLQPTFNNVGLINTSGTISNVSTGTCQ